MTVLDRVFADRVFGSPVLRASDWPVLIHRDEVHELCRRHGEDPHRILRMTYEIVDMPLLRFARVLSVNGHPYLACYPRTGGAHLDHEGGCMLASLDVDHALIGQLPDWWQPS